MTSIEKEFKSNQDQFIITGYKDDRAVIEMLNNTEVLAFNLWSMLKKTEPPLDEIRIKYATPEEVEAWEEAIAWKEAAERLTNE